MSNRPWKSSPRKKWSCLTFRNTIHERTSGHIYERVKQPQEWVTLPILLNRCFVHAITSTESLGKCIRRLPSLSIFGKRSFSANRASIIGTSDDKIHEEPFTRVAPISCKHFRASVKWATQHKEGWHVRLRSWSVHSWSFSWCGGWDAEYIGKGFYYGADQDMTNHPFFGLNLY